MPSLPIEKLRCFVLLAFRKSWWWIRQIDGDAAYDNYLLHAQHAGAPQLHTPSSPSPRLTRAEFYRDSLRRRYSTINRCC